MIAEEKTLKLYRFFNSFTGASGGDTRFVEIMKCLCKKSVADLTVVTSNMGKNFLRRAED